MITKNFKNIIALIFEMTPASNALGIMESTNIQGNTRYMGARGGGSTYPASVTTSVNFSSAPGIVIGTGNTPATENDYHLEAQITSGLTAGAPSPLAALDNNGNPYIDYAFTLTNTTASDITVKEIGWVQSIYESNTAGTTAGTVNQFLLDRTILDHSVTVPAYGTAAIKYQLKTIIS